MTDKKTIECPNCGEPVEVYRNPAVTVDIIIHLPDGIVLIERKNPPYGWALPGGFVDYGESLETAAHPEAKEETGVELDRLEQFRANSEPAGPGRRMTTNIWTCFLPIKSLTTWHSIMGKFLPTILHHQEANGRIRDQKDDSD